MQATVEQDVRNPLAGLISNDLYRVLEEHDLLSEKGIRDYQIRLKFKALRNADIPAFDAIEQIREEHPYLQFDTIRKIVYKMNCRH